MGRLDDTGDEFALLNAVIARDAGAWDSFFRRYKRLIISCIRKTLYRCSVPVTGEELDDQLSSVCLELVRADYKKLRAYDPEKGYKISSWIGLITTNAVYDSLRRRGPPTISLGDREAAAPERADLSPGPAELAEQNEKHRMVLSAIEHLSPGERSFVHYYYGEGLEPQEIAELLNVSVNTIYSRKNKVRASLRRVIGELMENSGED